MNNWARELARGLVDIRQLVNVGLVNANDVDEKELAKVQAQFDIRVPATFVAPISDRVSSLHAQFVPSPAELNVRDEEFEDPIGDERHSPLEGLTHRYPDRVLLKPTYQCASYCRFCFRRYKVSSSAFRLEGEALAKALDYLREHTEVWEVILSGGDPLTLTDSRLEKITQGLAQIAHIKVLRIHTRIPTVLPSRVTPELTRVLEGSQKQVFVVAHVNAVEELGEESREAIALLRRAGFMVLSQSVLLKGVNDSEQKLEALFRALVEHGVKPYYLHYPDLAKGTHHFRVPLEGAVALVEGLRGRLSGLGIPQLIVDIPGGHGKIALSQSNWRVLGPLHYTFLSPMDGAWHAVQYPLPAPEVPSLP